jgi:hypothetical protein
MKKHYEPVTMTVMNFLSCDVLTASKETKNFTIDWLDPFGS